MAEKTMVTNVVEDKFDIDPGEELRVHPFQLSNTHIHSCLTILSRGMGGFAESQSNNSYSALVPREIASLWTTWETFKSAFEFTLTHNDPPSGTHENVFVVGVPSKKYIMECPNQKAVMVLNSFYNLCDIMATCEASKFNGNIDQESEKLIREAMVIVEATMQFWLGTGKDNTDVGAALPPNSHLGTLIPDLDKDWAKSREAGSGLVQSGRPDVQDISKGNKQ